MLQLLTADVDVSARTQAEMDAIWFSWSWFFAAAAVGEAETIVEITVDADAAVLAETACGFWSCSAAAAVLAETASAANASTFYAEIKSSDWAKWGCRAKYSWAALLEGGVTEQHVGYPK